MSAVLVRQALETALAAMSPALSTAFENVAFTPANGVPYQQVNLLFAEPDNPEMSNGYTERGIFQITLRYPLNGGPALASARAQLIRTHFYRGRSFTASGVSVSIERTPEIGSGRTEDDRFVIPVRVRFYSHIPRS